MASQDMGGREGMERFSNDEVRKNERKRAKVHHVPGVIERSDASGSIALLSKKLHQRLAKHRLSFHNQHARSGENRFIIHGMLLDQCHSSVLSENYTRL